MFKYKIVSPIFMWLIVSLGSGFCLFFFDWQKLFQSNFINIAVFIITFIFWFYIFSSALKVHRQAIRSTEKIDKLITTGIYSKICHPIYVGDILLAWAVFILFPYFNVLIGVIWLSFVLLVWMKIEERSLLDKFGQEYEAYRQRTRWFRLKKPI